MKYNVFILLLFTGFGMFGQNTVDSLKSELVKAKVDSVKFRLHFMISQQYLKAGEYDSQFVHASMAIELADKIATLNEQQKKIYAGALRLKGIYSRIQGDYSHAIDFYLQTLNIFETLNDSLGQASTINSIGLAYLGLKRYDEAYDYFNRAYLLDHALNKPAKEVADITNMCYALHGDGYRPDSVFTRALNLGIKAMELAKEIEDKYLIISSTEAVAISLLYLKRYDQSMIYQQQALSLSEEIGSKPLIAEQQYLLAQLYNETGEYSKAIEYGLKSEKIAIDESIYSYLKDIYSNLAIAYEGTGNWEKAFEYSKKLNAILDSTYQTQITEQLKRFESERKDNQINKLSTENEIKENQNQLLKSQNEITAARLQRNQTFLLAAIVSIFLLALLLYLLFRNRQIKSLHIRELESLNAQLNFQKDEILRINTILELKALRAQMNPHFIFNCMSSIQECMLTGRLDYANTYLSKFSKLLRMVLEYSDNESVSLDKELEMLELYLMMESVRLKDGFEYEIDVDTEIYPEEVQIPTLILQPFAENAIWHGLLNKPNNRKLKISIYKYNETLNCTIEDNGVGRLKAAQLKPLQKKHVSQGINLVEKRLAILKHKTNHKHTGVTIFDMVNSENQPQGTKVEIILPFNS